MSESCAKLHFSLHWTSPIFCCRVWKKSTNNISSTFEGTLWAWSITAAVVRIKNRICCWIIHLMWKTASKLLNKNDIQWAIITEWLWSAGCRWSSQVGCRWHHSMNKHRCMAGCILHFLNYCITLPLTFEILKDYLIWRNAFWWRKKIQYPQFFSTYHYW